MEVEGVCDGVDLYARLGESVFVAEISIFIFILRMVLENDKLYMLFIPT